MLVVDDERDARVLVRCIAESAGVEVVAEAADGETAGAEAATVAPDVIVMDWAMPGVDGVEATRRIKRARPGVAVIGHTASGEPAAHRALLEAGAAVCVRKGDVSRLVEAFEAVAPPSAA